MGENIILMKDEVTKQELEFLIEEYWKNNKEKLFKEYFKDKELRSVFMHINFDKEDK